MPEPLAGEICTGNKGNEYRQPVNLSYSLRNARNTFTP